MAHSLQPCPSGIEFKIKILTKYFLKAQSIKGESEIANALRAAGERGNKLSEVEDRTELLANRSKV